MKVTDRFKSAIQAFRAQETNTMGTSLARDFLKHGNTRPLVKDWSKVVMTDEDLYTGYPYAAINIRANKVSQLALNNIKTDALPEVMDAARAKEEEVRHPYLDVINESKTFSNYKFWYDISTYLDLEGVYYLFVLRTVGDPQTEDEGRIGTPLEFRLLNPYNIRRVLDKQSYEKGIVKVGGYVETRDGLIRTFKPETIIEIRKLNPFTDEQPYSMTDAAKESQFTLKQAGDYTRHSLKNNMAAPGIISTDVLLDPEQFTNFVSRIMNQEKGIPLFGNGAGAITWDDMQTDLDKAALDKINEINRQSLFAVSGVGKTMSAIEESGTTRDTAKVQKDLFIENHVMPQLQLIIDALNQDYKVRYASVYESNKYEMTIDNPLGTDREAELKDIEIRKQGYELYDKLIAQGYKPEIASKYSQGLITLEELGEPTEEPRPNPQLELAAIKAGQPNQPQPQPKKKPSKQHIHDHVEVVMNEFDEEEQGLIQTQQASLQNSIMSVEARIVNAVLENIFKATNAFDNESDVISETEKDEFISELALILGAFYGILMPIYASSTMAARTKEFGVTGTFKVDAEVKQYIQEVSRRASESHVKTVLKDVRETIQQQYEIEVQRQIKLISDTGRAVTDDDLVLARRKALEGASRINIINAVKKEYAGNITDVRAKAIARTETNRAFTQSQYHADIQFIRQNGFEGRAYKKWTTRSSNPCAICSSLAKQGPIPFRTNFADLGDELKATYVDENGKTKVLKQVVNFEELTAGIAHVNCACRYILVII